MIDIDRVKRFVDYVSNTESRTKPTPAEFNEIVDRALTGWIMEAYGNDENYTPGQPIPQKGAQITQKISDDLRYLLTSKTFKIIDGVLPIPDGITVKDNKSVIAPEYLHLLSVRTTYRRNQDSSEDREVSMYNQEEWGSVISSRTEPPTLQFPKGTQYDTFFEIRPKMIDRAVMSYYRYPLTPVWGYILSGNRPVFDVTTSQNIEAPKEAFNAIVMRVLEFIGIHQREPELFQMAQSMDNKGI